MAEKPCFDVFRGTFPSTDAVWIAAIEGLAAAQSRMQEIALVDPGAYFVFGREAGVALATVDTSIPARDTTELVRGLSQERSPQFLMARAYLKEAHAQITELLPWVESVDEGNRLIEALGFVAVAINATERKHAVKKQKKAAS